MKPKKETPMWAEMLSTGLTILTVLMLSVVMPAFLTGMAVASIYQDLILPGLQQQDALPVSFGLVLVVPIFVGIICNAALPFLRESFGTQVASNGVYLFILSGILAILARLFALFAF